MASEDSKYGQLDTSTITNLSFAIFPFDDFTYQRPTGDVEVLLRNGAAESHSIPNSSGYYLFLDILGERHDIVIRSDKYFEATKTIDLVELRTQDASFVKNPVIPVPLLPNASYPFSPSSTLIRGTVKSAPTDVDPNQRPVSNATVKVNKKVGQKDISCVTNENGDYILFFKDLLVGDTLPKEENGIKKKFINFEGGFEFKLIIIHSDYEEYETESFPEGVEETKTKTIEKILLTKRG